MEDPNIDGHINSSDDSSILCRNLVSFYPVGNSGVTRLICVQQASVSTQISLTVFASAGTARHIARVARFFEARL